MTRISASQQAYQLLRRRIQTGDLAPGTELREAGLAEQTGLGRTPVREALGRLVQDGLVEVQPRHGYRVGTVTFAQVRELFELRLLLEPAAAELAARRADDAALESLAELANKHGEHGEHAYEEFLSDNRDFHTELAVAGGNRLLARSIHELLQGMQRIYHLSGAQPSEEVHSHAALHRALLDRDADLARRLVVEQIESSRNRLLTALQASLVDPTRTPLIRAEV